MSPPSNAVGTCAYSVPGSGKWDKCSKVSQSGWSYCTLSIYTDSRKWYRWICLQSWNRDAEVERRPWTCEHRGGSGAWEKWRSSSDIYPLPPVNRCRAGGGHTARAAHLHLRDDLDGWGGKACMQTYSWSTVLYSTNKGQHCKAIMIQQQQQKVVGLKN